MFKGLRKQARVYAREGRECFVVINKDHAGIKRLTRIGTKYLYVSLLENHHKHIRYSLADIFELELLPKKGSYKMSAMKEQIAELIDDNQAYLGELFDLISNGKLHPQLLEEKTIDVISNCIRLALLCGIPFDDMKKALLQIDQHFETKNICKDLIP